MCDISAVAELLIVCSVSPMVGKIKDVQVEIVSLTYTITCSKRKCS